MEGKLKPHYIYIYIISIQSTLASTTEAECKYKQNTLNFYLCTVHFEIYVIHSPKNALFINYVKGFKCTLKYTIISLLHVSVFNDHHQVALSVRN